MNSFSDILEAHNLILISVIIFTFPFVFFFTYKKIRPNFPVRVQCWFCGQLASVPFGNKNCWDCLSCEQYNGFKEDGDYNKPIPAQFDEDLNYPVVRALSKPENHQFRSSNGLCSQCNINQAVKVKLLSSFVPTHFDTEENDLINYNERLEKLYSLCWLCDLHVQRHLADQDGILYKTWPILDKTMHFEHQNQSLCNQSVPKAIYLLFLASSLSLMTLLIFSIYDLLPIFGIKQFLLNEQIESVSITQLPQIQLTLLFGFITGCIAVVSTGRDRWCSIDAIFSFLWVTLQILYSKDILDDWMTFDIQNYLKAIFTFLTLIIGVLILKPKRRYPNTLFKNRVTTFKLNKPEIIKESPIFNVYEKNTSKEVPEDFLLPLDASFNAVHITPPESRRFNLCEDDLAHEFEISPRTKYPIVRPARFTPPPLTHASWVAGGFWSLPTCSSSGISHREGTAIKFAMAGFQTSGLFTPPPSVTGSQTSQFSGFAGSINSNYGHRSYSGSSTTNSWPPSLQSNKSYKTQFKELGKCRSVCSARSTVSSSSNKDTAPIVINNSIKSSSKLSLCRTLVISLVSLSVLGNLLFLGYLASPYFKLKV